MDRARKTRIQALKEYMHDLELELVDRNIGSHNLGRRGEYDRALENIRRIIAYLERTALFNLGTTVVEAPMSIGVSTPAHLDDPNEPGAEPISASVKASDTTVHETTSNTEDSPSRRSQSVTPPLVQSSLFLAESGEEEMDELPTDSVMTTNTKSEDAASTTVPEKAISSVQDWRDLQEEIPELIEMFGVHWRYNGVFVLSYANKHNRGKGLYANIQELHAELNAWLPCKNQLMRKARQVMDKLQLRPQQCWEHAKRLRGRAEDLPSRWCDTPAVHRMEYLKQMKEACKLDANIVYVDDWLLSLFIGKEAYTRYKERFKLIQRKESSLKLRWDQQEEASTKRKSAMEKKDTARKKRRLSLDSDDNDLDLDFWKLSFWSKRKKRDEDAEDEDA